MPIVFSFFARMNVIPAASSLFARKVPIVFSFFARMNSYPRSGSAPISWVPIVFSFFARMNLYSRELLLMPLRECLLFSVFSRG